MSLRLGSASDGSHGLAQALEGLSIEERARTGAYIRGLENARPMLAKDPFSRSVQIQAAYDLETLTDEQKKGLNWNRYFGSIYVLCPNDANPSSISKNLSGLNAKNIIVEEISNREGVDDGYLRIMARAHEKYTKHFQRLKAAREAKDEEKILAAQEKMRRYDSVLILHSDAVCNPEENSYFLKVMKCLPEDWGVLLLNHSNQIERRALPGRAHILQISEHPIDNPIGFAFHRRVYKPFIQSMEERLSSYSRRLRGPVLPIETKFYMPHPSSLVERKRTSANSLVYGPIPASRQKGHDEKGKTLIILMKILKNQNIECFLDGSTLLGAYRNQHLIPYDDSEPRLAALVGDFDRIYNSLRQLDQNQFEVQDWSIVKDGASLKNFLKIRVLRQDGSEIGYFCINFYGSLPEGNKYQWINPYPDQFPNKVWEFPVPKDLIFPLQEIEFCGSSVYAPAKLREYLVYRYNDTRPTMHYDAETDSYIPTTGKEFTTQQRDLVSRYIPVLGEDIELDFSEYPHTGLEMTPIIPESVRSRQCWKELVLDLTELFKAVNIPFWVDTGHLLGIYRHEGGQIIPWDHDCDLGTLQAFFPQIWEIFRGNDETFLRTYGREKSEFEALKPGKYSLEDWSLALGEGERAKSFLNYFRIRILSMDGGIDNSCVDLYAYQIHPETTGKIISKIEPYPKNMGYPHRAPLDLDTVFPLRQAKFYGKNVPVPHDTYGYLVYMYKDVRPLRVWDESKKDYVVVTGHASGTLQLLST